MLIIITWIRLIVNYFTSVNKVTKKKAKFTSFNKVTKKKVKLTDVNKVTKKTEKLTDVNYYNLNQINR